MSEQTISQLLATFSYSEQQVFKVLQAEGPNTQAGIATGVNMSQSSVSRALASLIKMNHVRELRGRDPVTKRSNVKLFEVTMGYAGTEVKRVERDSVMRDQPEVTFNLVTKSGEVHAVSLSDLLAFVDTLDNDWTFTEGQPNELLAFLMRALLTKYKTPGIEFVDVPYIQDKIRAAENYLMVLRTMLNDGRLWTVAGQPSVEFLSDVPDVNVEHRVLVRKLVIERP